MPKIHIRERMTKEQYDDLYHRRITVRALAKELGVNENYLSHAVPDRAPKRNPKLLKASRNLFQDQVAREALQRRHSVKEAAKIAHVSERTMFRRMKKLREA